MLDYGEHGELESLLARAFIADAIADLGAKLIGRDAVWGVDAGAARRRAPVRRSPPLARSSSSRSPRRCRSSGTGPRAPPRRLRARRARRSTASPRTRSARSPSTCTAPTPTSPRTSSPASPSSAASASRCPRSTAGSRPAASPTTSAWSSPPRSCRGARSASAARSSPAPRSSPARIVTGGTEEQKQRWLPRIAAGELMVGVMVTEPDFGSDVAGVRHDGHPGRRRLPHQRREDVGDVRRARRHC